MRLKIYPDYFADEYLKEYILANGVAQNGTHFIDSSDVDFLNLFRDFLYALEESSDGETLQDIFRKRFHIVTDAFTPAKLDLFLKELNKFVLLDLPADGRFRFRILNDSAQAAKRSILNASTWPEFVEQMKYVNRFHPEGFNRDNFSNLIDYISLPLIRKGDLLYRARICERGQCFGPMEIGMPPRGLSSDGRVAAKGIGCLYLADNDKTAVSEVRAGQNDCVTVGKFVAKRDIVLTDFRLLKKLSLFEDPDALEWIVVNYDALNAMASNFEQPQLITDNVLNYLPTQYISDCVRALKKSEGVAYGSTMGSGFNVALFNPDAVECLTTKAYRVSDVSFNLCAT